MFLSNRVRTFWPVNRSLSLNLKGEVSDLEERYELSFSCVCVCDERCWVENEFQSFGQNRCKRRRKKPPRRWWADSAANVSENEHSELFFFFFVKKYSARAKSVFFFCTSSGLDSTAGGCHFILVVKSRLQKREEVIFFFCVWTHARWGARRHKEESADVLARFPGAGYV